MTTRRSVVTVLAVAMFVLVVSIGVLIALGSQVSSRLGGPCSFPEQGPLPSFCSE